MILDDYLTRMVKELEVISPAIFGSVFGWVSFMLSKREPGLTGAQIVGGIMLSAFTGASTCIMFSHMGFDPNMSAMMASMIGASGMRGYEWITQKVLGIITKAGG